MRKILVVMLRDSGDVLLATPTLRTIKAAHSGSLQEVRALSHADGTGEG
jgi:ADP-heptose:LPS heptosyltransferase